MRIATSAVLGLFLTATLSGCGGASLPAPPDNAKPGPPPGTSDDMTKPPPPEKKKK